MTASPDSDAARETQPIVWVLADDRAGNRAQCLGVADRLGFPFITKEIGYTALVKLPNALRGASLLGLSGKSKKALSAPWPDVVISAGRRSAPIARWIKKRSPRSKLVQLMWPDSGIADFDCIVLPSHDKDHADTPQILRVLGAPHRIQESLLESIRPKWQEKLAHIGTQTRIALLVGGSTKHGAFEKADFHRLGALTATLARSTESGVMITTSRRTGDAGESTLMEHLKPLPHHLHSWKDKQAENPYLGYLALADAIVVTADSIAMCSEACATHKPVFIYQPNGLSAKHQRFVNTLIATGYAYPLEEDFVQEMRKPLKHNPLDSAETVAEHIRTTFLAKGNGA